MTFQEALLRRGIRFRSSSGDRQKTHLNCPFCSQRGKAPDTQFHLCVHSRQGWGRCVYCNWKHRYAILPVLKALGVPDTVTGAELDTLAEKQEVVTLPKDFIPLTRVYDELDLQARNYVLKRGITAEQIKNGRIGVSYSGRYAYRILFPVYVDSELKAINARDFTGTQKPKYLLSRGDKYLYRFDPKQETIVFSEGVIKALRIEQVTSFGSSALLGHDLTDPQLEQLQNSACKHAILFPDPDAVGRQGVAKIAEKLREQWGKKISIVTKAETPADELPLENLRETIKSNCREYDWVLRQRLLLQK